VTEPGHGVPDVPEILTERLHLRAWNPERTAVLAELQADADLMRYIGTGGIGAEQTAEQVAGWMEQWRTNGHSVWAACDRTTGRCIGRVGVSRYPEVDDAEVGWLFGRPWQGRGLATEGARASLRFVFETVGLDRVISICRPENVASERIMRKLGMVYEREDVHWTLGFPLRIYAIARARWESLEPEPAEPEPDPATPA